MNLLSKNMQKRRVLFIDSALPDEIERALSEGFQGVTTNPSLVAKAPKGDASKSFMERYLDHMQALAQLCEKYKSKDGYFPSLSVEVFSLDSQEMISQAKEIREKLPYKNLAVKIPISYKAENEKEARNYLAVIRELAQEGFQINATCGFTQSQLELAAQAGARFISLFYNRLIDHKAKHCLAADSDLGEEKARVHARERALQELHNTRNFLDNSSLECEIILGSIRYSYDITDGWRNGADIVTTGYKVMQGLIAHPATDDSVKRFDADLRAWFSS